MVSSDLAAYKPLFIQTSWDYLRKLESCLLLLREDATNHEALEIMHIASHSLKSQCLVMGYTELGETCHELEKVSKLLLDSALKLSSDDMLKISGIVTSMKDVLTMITSDQPEPEMSGEKHILHEMQEKRGGAA